MKKFECISSTNSRYSVDDLKPFLSGRSIYKIATLSEYGICPKDMTERIQKAIMEITAVEVYTEEDGIKHDILNFGKMRNKSNSDYRERTKVDTLKDLLIFTISCGLFLSFVILIWNYDSENLDFGTPSYNFVVSIFIVITIFMILWKTRK